MTKKQKKNRKKSIRQPKALPQTFTIAKPVAPEDLRVGDYVMTLSRVLQLLGGSCDPWSTPEIMRVEIVPPYTDDAMRVRAVCVPYVFVEEADGDFRTIDVRIERLGRVEKNFAREAFRQVRARNRSRGSGPW